MSNKLELFAQKLKEREALFFNVVDNETLTETFIDRRIDQKSLDEKYQGDISVYLKTLKDRSFKSVQIMPRLSNGSTDKPAKMATIIVNLVPKTAPMQTPATQTATTTALNNQSGLMGGLNLADVMEGHTAKQLLLRAEASLETALKTIEAVKEKRNEYRNRIQKLERKLDKADVKEELGPKTSFMEKLQETIANDPSKAEPFLPLLEKLSGFMVPKSNNGLNAPEQNLKTATPAHAKLLECISTWPEGLVIDLIQVANLYNTNNEDFVQACRSLVKQHQLKKVESNA